MFRLSPKVYAIIAIVILAILGFFFFRNAESPSTSPDVLNTIEEQDGKQEENALFGILRKTDDIERGNLILETAERKIYINTTRDFSSLIDKEVTAVIEGNFENFRLVNISEKK